ncbi:hypothetical protein DYU11_11555 [Fibrisoma montanum]|uniref:Uncharacterized protein n=1 Tax=Fibrisoma montanum TaxID=2305895 RepID=A0A418MB89_9BACT|nr:hypothetical protein [Fibrisoma montanum]RIV23610.1 hypothetical protein DYU11_11555 [Fibrisoma montanum]
MPLTYSQLLTAAQQIRQETIPSANTAERVGAFLENLAKSATLPYDPDAEYAAGQNVIYQNYIYRALAPGALLGESPVTAPAKWRKMGLITLQEATDNGQTTTNDLILLQDEQGPTNTVYQGTGQRGGYFTDPAGNIVGFGGMEATGVLSFITNVLNTALKLEANGKLRVNGQKVYSELEPQPTPNLQQVTRAGGQSIDEVTLGLLKLFGLRFADFDFEFVPGGYYDGSTLDFPVVWQTLVNFARRLQKKMDLQLLADDLKPFLESGSGGTTRGRKYIILETQCFEGPDEDVPSKVIPVVAATADTVFTHPFAETDDLWIEMRNPDKSRQDNIPLDFFAPGQFRLNLPTGMSSWTGKIRLVQDLNY